MKFIWIFLRSDHPSSCPVYARPNHNLDGSQIDIPVLRWSAKQHLQPLVYLAGDLLMDLRSRS